MKKLITLVAIAIFLFTMAGLVYATGYTTPTAGQNPHYGYADATDKCKVCHAVHGAGDGEALLRSTRANACNYCHVSSNFAIKTVYEESTTLYSGGESDKAHNVFTPHGTDVWNGCVSCHSVHGASIIATDVRDSDRIVTPKILKANAGSGKATANTSITDLCYDCHEDTITYPSGSGCDSCHVGYATAAPGFYFSELRSDSQTAYLGAKTHWMTTNLYTIIVGTPQGAWIQSYNCRDCHSGGTVSQTPATNGANNWPHKTTGIHFLDDSYTTRNAGLDRTCLNCHLNTGDPGTATQGVGKTY